MTARSTTAHERGNAHVARGEWNDAVRCYREAVAASPGDSGTHIALAFALTQAGDNPSAQDALREAVAIDPTQADAHYLLAQIAEGSGDSRRAVAHLRDAIRHRPGFYEAHRELIQTSLGWDAAGAREAAAHAVELFPQDAEFWFYLGTLNRQAGDHAGAVVCLERACAIRPDALPPRAAIAKLLAEQKRFAEALPHCESWAALAPQDADAHMTLGSAQSETGNTAQAVASYRRSLAIRPHAGIDYIVACLTGQTPDRAPDEYVAQLFDTYAADFDSHLVGTLKYGIPKEIVGLIIRASARKIDDVLDLGCGTGLMGAELAATASNLVGVDVSEKMLEKARARNLYKRLVKGDLVEMMTGEPASAYDVVVATDVFVYVGKLDASFAQARRVLRPQGSFAFSVEAAASGDHATVVNGYILHQQGRYAHTKEYLEALAASNGFAPVDFRRTVVRENRGVPVPGYIAVLRRA
jgi:predicted TPR repeat methyltransferase